MVGGAQLPEVSERRSEAPSVSGSTGDDSLTLMKRFVARNAAHIGALDPSLTGLPFNDQVSKLQTTCDEQYRGDFVKYLNVLQADELDLRLRTSYQVANTIGPKPDYAPPRSCAMDGYQTARAKHREQIQRVLTSARAIATSRGTPIVAGEFNRTKGTIAGYGGFSEWTKFRQLNATAMLKR